MQFVFDGMFAAGLVLVGLWLWSLRGSITRDKAEAEAARVTAEREFLAGLGAGCMAPVGAHATIKGGLLTLEGWVGAIDGSQLIRATTAGEVAECADLGAELAQDMLGQGASELIEAARV